MKDLIVNLITTIKNKVKILKKNNKLAIDRKNAENQQIQNNTINNKGVVTSVTTKNGLEVNNVVLKKKERIEHYAHKFIKALEPSKKFKKEQVTNFVIKQYNKSGVNDCNKRSIDTEIGNVLQKLIKLSNTHDFEITNDLKICKSDKQGQYIKKH